MRPATAEARHSTADSVRSSDATIHAYGMRFAAPTSTKNPVQLAATIITVLDLELRPSRIHYPSSSTPLHRLIIPSTYLFPASATERMGTRRPVEARPVCRARFACSSLTTQELPSRRRKDNDHSLDSRYTEVTSRIEAFVTPPMVVRNGSLQRLLAGNEVRETVRPHRFAAVPKSEDLDVERIVEGKLSSLPSFRGFMPSSRAIWIWASDNRCRRRASIQD